MQNQSNSLITFDTQLKSVLMIMIMTLGSLRSENEDDYNYEHARLENYRPLNLIHTYICITFINVSNRSSATRH